jgi:hypothetical protein
MYVVWCKQDAEIGYSIEADSPEEAAEKYRNGEGEYYDTIYGDIWEITEVECIDD